MAPPVSPVTEFIITELLKEPGEWVDVLPIRTEARDYIHPGQAQRKGRAIFLSSKSRKKATEGLGTEELEAYIRSQVTPDILVRRGSDTLIRSILNNQRSFQHIEVDKDSKFGTAKRVRITIKGVRNWISRLKDRLPEEDIARLESYLRKSEKRTEDRLFGRAEQNLLAIFHKYTSRHNGEHKRSHISAREFVRMCADAVEPIVKK